MRAWASAFGAGGGHPDPRLLVIVPTLIVSDSRASRYSLHWEAKLTDGEDASGPKLVAVDVEFPIGPQYPLAGPGLPELGPGHLGTVCEQLGLPTPPHQRGSGPLGGRAGDHAFRAGPVKHDASHAAPIYLR